MPDGIYANAGVDADGSNDVVDTVLSGPISVTKTGDGDGPNNDPLVLDLGDSFTITGSSDPFVFVGTDGAGGILATNFNDGSSIWLTDSTVSVGTTWPALVEENATICFAAGTMIATPIGEVPVENLQRGDLIRSADGRKVPVKWIGHQTVHRIFTPAERFCPVRIKAGALDENVPHTDLVVTPDHGIMVSDIMVNAGALVNGTSIVRVPAEELPEKVVYYHVETEDHDVIVAAGAPSETFIDNATRGGFDNAQEYVALYGDIEREMTEQPYPRAMSRRQLTGPIRAHLDDRAVAISTGDAVKAA